MVAAKLTHCRFTPAARSDLEAIWLYTMQAWSADQADRYTDILEDTFDRLLFMPELGRERLEFDPPVRVHPSAEHIILYRVETDHLVILRVLGGKQDWPAIFRALDP